MAHGTQFLFGVHFLLQSSFLGTQLIELRSCEFAEMMPPGPERNLALQMLVNDFL